MVQAGREGRFMEAPVPSLSAAQNPPDTRINSPLPRCANVQIRAKTALGAGSGGFEVSRSAEDRDDSGAQVFRVIRSTWAISCRAFPCGYYGFILMTQPSLLPFSVRWYAPEVVRKLAEFVEPPTYALPAESRRMEFAVS